MSTSPAVIRLRRASVPPRRESPRPVGSGQEGQEWCWEGNIQAKIREHLETEGWMVLESADTESRAQGIDLLLARGNKRRAVEVKGYPSAKYARGPHKGEPKPTQPTLQARHWYAGVLLSAILLRERMPDAEVFLGFPDVHRYRWLLARTGDALRRLSLGVYLVTEAGHVFEFETPM